tara:strand:+ start:484 stop:693 length:210 start_codon:yes stop_codon:yes gene_type:complete
MDEKDKQIEELKSKFASEELLKKSEILMNAQLKERIKLLELHQETLLKINEEFSEKIAKLRIIIEKLSS